MHFAANDDEVVGILERHLVQIGNRELCSFSDEFAKTEGPLRMAMNNVAILRFASVRANFPFLRRGSNQHLARGGAGLPQG